MKVHTHWIWSKQQLMMIETVGSEGTCRFWSKKQDLLFKFVMLESQSRISRVKSRNYKSINQDFIA